MRPAAPPPPSQDRWQQVRLLPGATPVAAVPASVGRPASARIEIDGARYDRVPDTGFTMLVAWLTGPGNLVRVPDQEQYTTRVTIIQGSSSTTHTQPRTPADQELIDHDVQDYLADADVPAPPRGYRWYQRLPEGYDTLDDLHAHINAVLQATDPDGTITHPRDLARALPAIVGPLYPR